MVKHPQNSNLILGPGGKGPGGMGEGGGARPKPEGPSYSCWLGPRVKAGPEAAQGDALLWVCFGRWATIDGCVFVDERPLMGVLLSMGDLS